MAKRSTIKEHAAAKLMPKMSTAEFLALKDDIAKNGLHEPIWLKDGLVLDGRHRLRACVELGIPYATRTYAGDDVEAFVLSENVTRRHLSSAQQRSLLSRLLKKNPEKSDRQFATALGVSHHTVAGARDELESTGQIAQLTHTVGADGKGRPRAKKPSTASQGVRLASLISKHDLHFHRCVSLLKGIHPGELTDAEHKLALLRAQLERMEALLQPKRITL
jgi:ParB-like chromosome segregation protein Spo0J